MSSSHSSDHGREQHSRQRGQAEKTSRPFPPPAISLPKDCHSVCHKLAVVVREPTC